MIKGKSLEEKINNFDLRVRFKHKRNFIEQYFKKKESNLWTIEKKGKMFYETIQDPFVGSLSMYINGEDILKEYNKRRNVNQYPLYYLAWLLRESKVFSKENKKDNFFYTLWKNRGWPNWKSKRFEWESSHRIGSGIELTPGICFRGKNDCVEVSWDFSPEKYYFLAKREEGTVLVPKKIFFRALKRCVKNTKQYLNSLGLKEKIYGLN